MADIPSNETARKGRVSTDLVEIIGRCSIHREIGNGRVRFRVDLHPPSPFVHWNTWGAARRFARSIESADFDINALMWLHWPRVFNASRRLLEAYDLRNAGTTEGEAEYQQANLRWLETVDDARRDLEAQQNREVVFFNEVFNDDRK